MLLTGRQLNSAGLPFRGASRPDLRMVLISGGPKSGRMLALYRIVRSLPETIWLELAVLELLASGGVTAFDLVNIGQVGTCLTVTGSSLRTVVAAAACRPMLAGGASSASCDTAG